MAIDHKSYPSYRDSGVPWLGQVPSHWGLTRFKRIVDPRKYYQIGDGDHGSITPDMYLEKGVPYIRVQNLGWGNDINFEGMVYIDQETQARNKKSRLLPGDVLIAKTGATVGKTAVVPKSMSEANTTSSVAKVTPDPSRFDSGYVAYWCQSPQMQNQMWQDAVMKSAQPGFNVDDLVDYVLPECPLEEQRAIAAYLDRVTTQIDALIAQKRRLLELLAEKRQALITQAVTRGLDPKVRLKDSGVEWLGQVPEHWGIRRIKHISRLESGHTPSKSVGENWEGGEIPWVSLNDTEYLRTNNYVRETKNRITNVGLMNSSARMLPEGTVIFSRDATIGRCGIAAMPLTVSQHFIGWVCGPQIVPEYLLLVLRYLTPQLDRLKMGSTLKTIGMDDVGTMITIVPSIEEQKSIAKKVFELQNAFEKLASDIGDSLDSLRTLQKTIIAYCVTGKIKLRETL